MASLVDQIFKQAAAASANGEGFGDAAIQGMQIGQNQQRINLLERQLAMKAAQNEARTMLFSQQQRLNQYKLEEEFQKREAILGSEDAFQQLNTTVGNLIAAGKPNDARVAMLEAVGKNKGLWRHVGMEALREDVQNSIESSEALARIQTGDDYRIAQAKLRSRELDLREQNIERLSGKYQLNEVEKQKLEIWSKEIQELNKQRLELDQEFQANPDKASPMLRSRRMRLAFQAGALQKRMDALIQKSQPEAEPAANQPATEIHEPAAEERVRVKSPSGKIGTIPLSQLEAAVEEGYTQLE